jgi:putative membrane protein
MSGPAAGAISGHSLAGRLVGLLRAAWAEAPRAFRWALPAWVLGMILIPIFNWTIGEPALLVAIPASVIVQAAVVLIALVSAWGWPRTLRAALVIVGVTWAAEALGTATGFPFGAYAYTDRLGLHVLGVPALIPFAWLMMLPPAWAAARLIAGRWGGAAFTVASALALTAWDLFLDPQMVGWGLWVWRSGGGYFGIPWSNYLGWLLVAAIITLLVRPDSLPSGPLLLVYIVTWLLSSIGLAFFWGLPGPALVGFVVMGAVIAAAMARAVR